MGERIGLVTDERISLATDERISLATDERIGLATDERPMSASSLVTNERVLAGCLQRPSL